MTAVAVGMAVLASIALVGAGFIAFSEAALLSADRRLLKQRVAEGNAAARRTLYVVTRPQILHGTLLFLINIFIITYTSAGDQLLHPWLHGWTHGMPQWAQTWVPVLVSVLILDSILLLFGEILPKTWALTNIPRYSLVIGPIILRLGLLLKPIAEALYVIPAKILGSKADAHGAPLLITEAQLRIALDLGTTSGAIEQTERELGLKVIDVAETTVDRVMTLRRDIFSLPAEMTVRQALEAIRENPYSRIPLFRNRDLDDVVGILHIKDLMGAYLQGSMERPLSAYARPVLFIPEKKRVIDLMLDFKAQHSLAAIVVDEAGSVAGLVTLEDCLEEVVGEIYDEHDAPEDFIRQVGDQTFVVDGRADVDEVMERLGVELDDSDYKTMGGLTMGIVGRVPVTGMRIHHGGLTITVTRMVGRRVDKLRIHRLPQAAEDAVPDPPPPAVNPRVGSNGHKGAF